MLKFLLLILAILAVWYGYRYVNRPKPPPPPVPPAGTKPGTPPEAAAAPRAEDMAACAVCGTYVAESTAKSCGRSDCPYPPA
ncbi:hypothetical protein [Ferrovibrio sp.]|uniref:hypothetical protein n=1 Tax=Ferrovibrio sp. TaxID=1917215 RepID=UPI00311D9624